MSSQMELSNTHSAVPPVSNSRGRNEPQKSLLDRSPYVTVAGFIFGAATQALFLWTVIGLFRFLRYGGESTQAYSPLWDTGWAMFFALPHSMLLVPAVNKLLRRSLPSELLGCVHCTVTCISLLVLFHWWTPSSDALWRLEGWSASVVLAGFYGSWIALFYSLYLTGMGYQTGALPWFYWLRGQKPPIRGFAPTSLYRWMRHPVYLSFLGLIWFTPLMTLDHAVLTLIWTVYIYVGSYLKDKRLEYFIGQPYRDYSRTVTGFPLIGFGPWGRRSG
jgi:protein-S-isoprenylcysteine O-methyltransferase Ste14